MRFKKLLLGVGLVVGAGIGALLAAPGIGNATQFCIVCGSTTDTVSVSIQGLTAENADTVGVNPLGGAAIDGGSCSAASGGGTCNETTWGIGFIKDVFDRNANQLWSNGQSGGQRVSFMISGIADEAIAPTGTGFNIYNTGSNNAGQTANYGAGAVGIGGNGGIHLRLFSYIAGSNPNLGTLATSGRTGAETFSGITNNGGSELLADFLLIPGIVAPGTKVNGHDVSNATLFQNAAATTQPTTATGDFYADCVGGYACGSGSPPASTTNQFNNNGQPDFPFSSIIAAIFGAFTAIVPTATQAGHGWGEFLNDPALTAIPFSAPEPASLALLGSMLTVLGIGVTLRRRKTG